MTKSPQKSGSGDPALPERDGRPNIRMSFDRRQFLIWLGVLAAGTVLGLLNIPAVNTAADVIARIYTRLFQMLAVPTIALAVITTLSSFGNDSRMGRIFRRALLYTVTTTFVAAAVGLLYFILFKPGNLPPALISGGEGAIPTSLKEFSLAEHFMSVVPDNILRPVLEGNVLSLLIIAFAVGLAIAKMPQSEGKSILTRGLAAAQEVLFILIRWLIWTLPLGILAFSEQLAAQMSSGNVVDSLGTYIAVIICGNLTQMFVVLPLFLLSRGLNPLRVFSKMSPAILMALFTKSSAATLPLTMQAAELRVGVSPKVSRFVLPLCTTINMNGCAAFILVTSLFVMQNGGVPITPGTMITWLFISVIAAVGNAGVPMGCYFLTLSLMSGIGAPVAVMGVILPIYTIIDMIETAENVWSDSCVCAMTGRDTEIAERASAAS